MKRFAKLIGRLPFAGKMTIRPFIFTLYHSTTMEERKRSYLRFVVLIIFFVLLHGVQAEMGIRALSFNSPLWAKAISGLYAIANISVVLTQIYLGFKATRFRFCAPLPRAKRKDDGYSSADALIMMAVTLGGQILFLFFYNWYR